MSGFDNADIYELVCVYILNVLGKKYGKNKVGFYIDDGLAFENVSGLQHEKIRKNIIRNFKKELNLDIDSETNLKIVNCFRCNLNPFYRKISTS